LRTSGATHGVKTAAVPWARPGSGFTLLFEAILMEFVRNGMTMSATARLVGEHDTLRWCIIEHYVEEGLARLDVSALRFLGIDETSRARGHRYLTLFVDLEACRVVFIGLGKDSDTLCAFREVLVKRGGKVENVKEVSIDMSQAFIKGAQEQFPDAHLTFDRFHVIKLANNAGDEVRRAERKQRPEL
jgi:transposase